MKKAFFELFRKDLGENEKEALGRKELASKMIIKNKKGAEEYLSPWMFLIWVIIAVAIIIGVVIFNSAEIDVRGREAEILAVRSIDCLVDNGYVNEDFFQDYFNIYEKCGLEEEIITNGDYWLNVSVYSSGILLKSFTAGVKNFEMLCQLGESEDFPKCSEKKIYALRDNGEIITIRIIAGSNQPMTEL